MAVFALVVGGSTALTLRRLDHRYGPVRPGPFGGPYTRRNWVFRTTDVVAGVLWSEYHYPPGGNVGGVHTPWHNFPATVPAQGTIRLLLTVRHPDDCAAYPTVRGRKQAFLDGVLEVHRRSLLHDHTTAADVLAGTLVGIC